MPLGAGKCETSEPESAGAGAGGGEYGEVLEEGGSADGGDGAAVPPRVT